MTDPMSYSVLPPLLAIWSKQVIPSLLAGIWVGHTLLIELIGQGRQYLKLPD